MTNKKTPHITSDDLREQIQRVISAYLFQQCDLDELGDYDLEEEAEGIAERAVTLTLSRFAEITGRAF